MELLQSIPISKIAKIELYQNTRRLYMTQIRSQTGADFIINGGLFNSSFKPVCNVKSNGTVLSNPGYTEYGYAWNKGPDITYEVLPSVRSSYLGCVGLVLNGVGQTLHYPSSLGGCRQRSAIALKGQNLILYACNGSQSKTIEALQTYAIRSGWNSCLCLDGGGSTQMQCDAGILKSPENCGNGRIVQNYILVYLKKSSMSDSTAPQSNVCPYKEPSTLVKYGMRGDGCKWVQWQLNRVLNSGLVVDGIFGNASVSALKSFQRNKGLTVDGLCGQSTRNALKSA